MRAPATHSPFITLHYIPQGAAPGQLGPQQWPQLFRGAAPVRGVCFEQTLLIFVYGTRAGGPMQWPEHFNESEREVERCGLEMAEMKRRDAGLRGGEHSSEGKQHQSPGQVVI